MFNNLDAEVLHVNVLLFDNETFFTKYEETVHDHGLACPNRQERMRTELNTKLRAVYPHMTKVVDDERIGAPMLSKPLC
jgi:hypothetical protein